MEAISSKMFPHWPTDAKLKQIIIYILVECLKQVLAWSGTIHVLFAPTYSGLNT